MECNEEVASQGDLDCINEALDLENLISISQNAVNTELSDIKDPNEKSFMEGITLFKKELRKELVEFKKSKKDAKECEFTVSIGLIRDFYTFVNDRCFIWHTNDNCTKALLQFFEKLDEMRERFGYAQVQEYLKLLCQLKKNTKLWDSLTYDTQEAFITRISDSKKRMDDLVIEQRRALQIARRRKKKSEKDRKPLTLTGAMIDLSKDGIDKPVYEGLIKPKAIPKKRGEIIGPPCGPPGINLNPDNLPVILTEEEKVQFHIRVRDEKIRREREELDKKSEHKTVEEEKARQEQDAIDKMLKFRNSSPRRPKNVEESYDWFLSSEDEKETKDESDPSQVLIKKVQPTQFKGVRNILSEIRRNRENIQAGAGDNIPEQLLKDDKTTTCAGDISTKAPDDKENATSLENNKSNENNNNDDTDNDRSMVRDMSESNKSQNYRDENCKSESTLSPERKESLNVIVVDAKSEEVHSEDEITDRSGDKKSAKSGINEYKKFLAEKEAKNNLNNNVNKEESKLKSILKDDTNSVRLSQSTVNSKVQSARSKDGSVSQKSNISKTNKSRSKKTKKSAGKGKKGKSKKTSPINIVNVKDTDNNAIVPTTTNISKKKKSKKIKSKSKKKSKSRNASMASNVSEKSMDIDEQSVTSKSKGKSSTKKVDKIKSQGIELSVQSVEKEISSKSKITDKAESVKSSRSIKSKSKKKVKKIKKKTTNAKSDAASVCTDKSDKKKSTSKSVQKTQKNIVKDGDRNRAVREGKNSIKKEEPKLSQSSKKSEKKKTLREKLESSSLKPTPKKSDEKSNNSHKVKSKSKEPKKVESSKKPSKVSPKQKVKEAEEVKSKASEGKSSAKKSKSKKKQVKSKGKSSSTKSDKENAAQKKTSSKQNKDYDKIEELKQKIENNIKIAKSANKEGESMKNIRKTKGLKERRKKKDEINAEDYMI